jgi:hypothetical protein
MTNLLAWILFCALTIGFFVGCAAALVEESDSRGRWVQERVLSHHVDG